MTGGTADLPTGTTPADLAVRIRRSVGSLVGSPGFDGWLKKQSPKEEDLILLNNSFVFRSVRTTKNDRYLALRLGADGQVLPEPLIARGLTINADYKHIARGAKNSPDLIPLNEAVGAELAELGVLVFVLLGQIDDSIIVTTTLNHRAFDEIVWDPTLPDVLAVAGRRLSVKETYDEDDVSEALRAHYMARGEPVPDDLEAKLGEALDRLQDKAVAALRIPQPPTSLDGGITDSIVGVLQEELDLYTAALDRCGGVPEQDRAAFNEILRIAYNFASDAITFLNLIVSICDLKPIVLWGTIGEHYALSEAFRKLPWTRSRNKPSLKNYIDAIADARNSAFHNLFPFRKSLSIDLPQTAVRGLNLLLFSEHGRKKENQLVYRDKELVDVLTEFTRARQRQVPPRFWKDNLAVMDATITLFCSTSAHLKALSATSGGAV